jgi:signal transduction histidine kinase
MDKLILLQYRNNASYNDFIGEYYHFPKNKYLYFFKNLPVDFIYYEPSKAYFGFGVITKIFEDKSNIDHCFAKIEKYKPFSNEVRFYNSENKPREESQYYNVQNAVRMITDEEYKEIVLEGAPEESFVADANLISVMGEQLIANEKVGILELIKNSVDAGATYCNIHFEQLPDLPASLDYLYPDLPGPVIIIEDNGKGMDYNTLLDGWLRPASTIKTDVKKRMEAEHEKTIQNNNHSAYIALVEKIKKENNNRIPLGEKGIGRFAANRLGQYLTVVTKVKENDYELVLNINWELFEYNTNFGKTDLNDVKVCIKKNTPTKQYESGTRLIIYGKKENFKLTGQFIKNDIKDAITLLKSPRFNKAVFDVNIVCPQIPKEGLEFRSILDQVEAPIRLECLVNGDGFADLELHFDPLENIPLAKDFKREKVNLCQTDEDNKGYWDHLPQCGEFYLSVNLYYRTKDWYNIDVKAINEVLDNFGGISIFRDDINVYEAKWGSTVDWLGLTKRHIKQGFRISYYNMFGAVYIYQDKNLLIKDKTDRQGQIENQAWKDLCALIRTALLRAEIFFIGKRDEYKNIGTERNPKKLAADVNAAGKLVHNISHRYDVVNDPISILEDVISKEYDPKTYLINLGNSLKNMKESLTLIESVQDMLLDHASYGIALAVSVHEISKLTSNFYNSVTSALNGKMDIKEMLEPLQHASYVVRNELRRIGDINVVRNETVRNFSINDAVRYSLRIYEYQFEKKLITATYSESKNFELNTKKSAVLQILSNLISNSVYWLKGCETRKIHIEINSQKRYIIVADSGPGISEIIRPYLFQPGYSLKLPPSGLGLYICKYHMNSIKGRIYEAGINDRLPEYNGAQFLLDFSKVPEGKNEK